MQNKPNVKDAQINVNSYMKSKYEKMDNWLSGKNKPNSNPNKPNLKKAKMNVNLYVIGDYRKKDDFLVRINKPNLRNAQNERKLTYNKGLQKKRCFSVQKNKPNSNPIKACPERSEFTLSVIEGNGPIPESYPKSAASFFYSSKVKGCFAFGQVKADRNIPALRMPGMALQLQQSAHTPELDRLSVNYQLWSVRRICFCSHCKSCRGKWGVEGYATALLFNLCQFLSRPISGNLAILHPEQIVILRVDSADHFFEDIKANFLSVEVYSRPMADEYCRLAFVDHLRQTASFEVFGDESVNRAGI